MYTGNHYRIINKSKNEEKARCIEKLSMNKLKINMFVRNNF